MSEFGIRYRVKPISISQTIRIINLVRDNVFELQRSFLSQRYQQIFHRTLATTMVATGETRSKLFLSTSTISSDVARFECGYRPTSNDQSTKQEFDLGPVHHSKREHLNKDGSGKCSRTPVDIYSTMGQQYHANRSARRRALAKSIESSFNTQVKFAANLGHTLRYEPDLTAIVHKMTIIARAVTRLA